MKRKHLILVMIAAVLATAVWFATGASQRTKHRDEIYVPAAVSLAKAIELLARDFEDAHGIGVRVDFGSSGLLRKKIEAGARMDVFVSASEWDMNMLAAGGHVIGETRRELLRNTLVCVLDGSSTLRVVAATDLLSDDVRRIAIGDPAHVPAGIYAKEALEHMGLWADLGRKFIPCIDARAALVQVKVGSVEAAIVYASDVASAPAVKLAFRFPPASHSPIIYPACVLKESPRPKAAKAFLDFLSGDHAAKVFAAQGFEPIRNEVK